MSGTGLRIAVLQGRAAIQERFMNLQMSLARSADGQGADSHGADSHGAGSAWHFQRIAFDCDTLVVASDPAGTGYLGALSAAERHNGRESFHLLDSIVATNDAYGAALQRKLVSALLLRLAGVEDVPAAFAARTHQTALCQALRGFAEQADPVAFYPEPDSTVVSMRTGAMAVRIARATGIPVRAATTPLGFGSGLAVLDLRGAEETALIETARRLYRVRMPNRDAAASASSTRRGRRIATR